MKNPPDRATRKGAQHALEDEVQSALTWLKRHSTKRTREGMARYGIPSDNAFGVSVANIRVLAKRLGRNHELAAALWDTGWYEARMLTSFVDEPARVTPAQMDRWCRDFDNWAICDTVCFHLFDRTPHAWQKVAKWSDRREEFVKRAAFARGGQRGQGLRRWDLVRLFQRSGRQQLGAAGNRSWSTPSRRPGRSSASATHRRSVSAMCAKDLHAPATMKSGS